MDQLFLLCKCRYFIRLENMLSINLWNTFSLVIVIICIWILNHLTVIIKMNTDMVVWKLVCQTVLWTIVYIPWDPDFGTVMVKLSWLAFAGIGYYCWFVIINILFSRLNCKSTCRQEFRDLLFLEKIVIENFIDCRSAPWIGLEDFCD